MRLARPAAPVTPGALGPGRSVWPYLRHRRIRGPARGRSGRAPGRRAAGPNPAADGWTQAGRIALPTCAVHARAGGQALPSCTGAWSSRRLGTAGPGERLGADDIGVSRVGRKCLTPGALAPSPRLLDTDSFHCHLLGHVRAPAAGRGPALLADRSRGRYDSAPPWGVTRRWACGWNLPQPAAGHDSATGPARGTAVPPGGRLRWVARGSGRAGGRG